jgi:hypothetical protein
MADLYVTSRLGTEHRDALERMFYHHPEQFDLEDVILEHIKRFGSPQIVANHGMLSISVPLLPGALTLYAVERRKTSISLQGVMLIHRSGDSLLEMHHIAIAPEQTHRAIRGEQTVAALLIHELCRIGRCIRGIEQIRLAYHRGRIDVRQ